MIQKTCVLFTILNIAHIISAAQIPELTPRSFNVYVQCAAGIAEHSQFLLDHQSHLRSIKPELKLAFEAALEEHRKSFQDLYALSLRWTTKKQNRCSKQLLTAQTHSLLAIITQQHEQLQILFQSSFNHPK